MCQDSRRDCTYIISLVSVWIWAMGVTRWRPENERKGGPRAFSLLSLPWTATSAAAASTLWLQLPPHSPSVGGPGSGCLARLPPSGPDSKPR